MKGANDNSILSNFLSDFFTESNEVVLRFYLWPLTTGTERSTPRGLLKSERWGTREGINGDNIFIIEKLAWLQLKPQKEKFTSGKCIETRGCRCYELSSTFL